MELISAVGDPLLRNRYRYEILKRLNVGEEDLKYEVRPAGAAPVAEEAAQSTVGAVPQPEGDLAAMERELLRVLFHEPAELAHAITGIDLAALSGGPERLIGQAMLEALGEGRLPPDMDALAEATPGSLVAREVLERLQDAPEEQTNLADGARSLCVALAEAPLEGSKIGPGLRLEMCIRRMKRVGLEALVKAAERRFTNAKLAKDAQAEAEEYQKLVLLRKDLAKLKSLPIK